MTDFLATPTLQAGVAVVILAVLIAAAIYLVSSFRDYTAQDQESTSEALDSLAEMHRKGDISDEEFRTIKTTTHQRAGSAGGDDDGSLAEPSASES